MNELYNITVCLD